MNIIISSIFVVLLVFLPIEGHSSCMLSEYKQYRDKLSQSDLFDGRKLVRLSYIGSILDGQWAVFDALSVVEDMSSPRGVRQLIVINKEDGVLQTAFDMQVSKGALSVPLWCDGNKIYLHGRTSDVPMLTGGVHYNGNVIRFFYDEESIRYEFLDMYVYGSSGGISDEIPSKEQREQERRKWDEK